MNRPPQVSLQNLTNVHSPRHTQGVQYQINWDPIGQAYVLNGTEVGDLGELLLEQLKYPQGGTITFSDITTAQFEAYDSLEKVYALLVTLSGDPILVEFGFIANWPNLTPDQKRERYSKYACHELNFFLSRKDPAFFGMLGMYGELLRRIKKLIDPHNIMNPGMLLF